ncbi:MAG: helix-turn-helix domain-containing protein [Alphaproteobacteria bacterium]|nr:helix-turn-helix domain-containing protein [Alphaproteobacteria bacterium]
MSRSSPGVKRVAAILNFIADHPGQAFALTDLVRALKLSRATCHALLTGLVDVGYLYRTSDKTYVLGPALAAIGRTAAQHFSPLQVAQPEMRKLADEFNVLCGAYFLDDAVVHLRDRAASASHVGYPVPLGARFKLHEALAAVFFSDADKGFDQWLRTTDFVPGDVQKELFREGAAGVRRDGYIVIERKAGFSMDDVGYDADVATSTADLPIKVVTELSDERPYSVAAIMAPVHDEKGRISFALGITGFYSTMSAERVRHAGGQLRDACERVSDFIAGRSAQSRTA